MERCLMSNAFQSLIVHIQVEILRNNRNLFKDLQGFKRQRLNPSIYKQHKWLNSWSGKRQRALVSCQFSALSSSAFRWRFGWSFLIILFRSAFASQRDFFFSGSLQFRVQKWIKCLSYRLKEYFQFLDQLLDFFFRVSFQVLQVFFNSNWSLCHCHLVLRKSFYHLEELWPHEVW